MLISDDYRKQNELLHRKPSYGRRGGRHAAAVSQLCAATGMRSVLDYGCGKGDLARSLSSPFMSLDARSYDPAVPQFSERPSSAELVVCADVLEHVEPGCLDDVIDDIAMLAEQMALVVVATKPDHTKTLPDGRNPHLSVHPPSFWLAALARKFNGFAAMIGVTRRDCSILAGHWAASGCGKIPLALKALVP